MFRFITILGALFLINSSDLISIYLSIELQSFGLYILASLYKEKLSSTSAGLKYFLLGGLSSCIILLGSGLVYTYTGLTNLELIYTLLNIYANGDLYDINGIGIGFFLIFSGFLFKIAAAPFHNWSIDVYDDSPTLVTAWLTVMPKISILILLLQLLIGIGINLNLLNVLHNLPTGLISYAGSQNILSNLLLFSSLLSIIVGSIVGLSQIKIKRLLAYSTINHVGFLLLALSVFSSSTSNFSQSVESFLFYITQYTLTNLNIFLIILALGYIVNTNINNLSAPHTEGDKKIENSHIFSINISDMEYINSLKGLFIKNPILSISLAICLFSFAGVPPLVGFFAKQQVLYTSNSAGYYFLSLVAILVSVISAFYYLKIIKIAFSMPAINPINDKYINIFNNTINTLQNSMSRFNEEKKINFINSAGTTPTASSRGQEMLVNLILDSTINTEQALSSNEKKNKGLYTYTNNNIGLNTNNLVSNVHSLLIGVLTMFIINFIFNPILIFNSIAIIVANSLNL